MMASMITAVVSAVVVTRMIHWTIVDTSVVVISVPGITIPATVVAGPIKCRNPTETDTEVLGFGVGGDQSKQP
jgi:hypothetical protein